MKAINQLKNYFFILFFIISVQNLNASHSMGGYINYRCVDTVTGRYEITLHLFRDCVGIVFGTESIKIVTSMMNTSVILTNIATKEVTPLCQVPDVTVRATTNCPHGTITNIRGIEKHIYRTYVTLGKNIGWAYVGWGSCCRSYISNIQNAGGEGLWIQAAINTNHVNSSPLLNSEAASYLWQGKENWIDFSARDSFDTKYIMVDGRYIVRDSLVYEFYTPNINEGANPNSVVNLQNPSVAFIQGFSASQFIASNPAISLNNSAGIAKVNPTIVSDAVAAVVVKEYRAIPTSNGKSYTRQYIGHTCRDQVFFTSNSGTEISNDGVIADSSNVEFIVNPNLVRTCRAKGNRIVMKFSTTSSTALKIKDASVIHNQEISNYSFKVNTKQVGSLTIAYAEFKFDRNIATKGYEFKVKVYCCNAVGISVENYIPLSVQFTGGKMELPQDTMVYCIDGPALDVKLPLAESLSWSDKSNIIYSKTIDSNEIKIKPTGSKWYYVSNMSKNASCKVNDSVFIKMDTCNLVYGQISYDLNKNCQNESSEPSVQCKLILKGKTNNFIDTFVVAQDGNFQFSPPGNSSYDLFIQGEQFVCESNKNFKTVFVGNSNVELNLLVLDTLVNSSPNFKVLYSNTCLRDANVGLKIAFNKSSGFQVLKIEYGDGNYIYDTLRLNKDSLNLNYPYTYSSYGQFAPKIKSFNGQGQLIWSVNMGSIQVLNCLSGIVYADLNENCQFDSTLDVPLKNYEFTIKNISDNLDYNMMTNSKGSFNFTINTLTDIEFKSDKEILCNSNLKQKIVTPNLDSFYNISIPINPKKIVPTISVETLPYEISCSNLPFRALLKINKSIGYGKLVVKFSNGDTSEFQIPFKDGEVKFDIMHSWIPNKASLSFISNFYDSDNNLIHSENSPIYRHKLCLGGIVFRDLDSNCIDSSMHRLSNLTLQLRNLNDNSKQTLFSNPDGIVELKLDSSVNYQITSDKAIFCNYSNIISFNVNSMDKKVLNLPVIKINNNYLPVISFRGIINNTTKSQVDIKAIVDPNNFYYNPIDSNCIFDISLPDKCTLDSLSSANIVNQAGKKILVKSKLGQPFSLHLRFNNVTIGEDLCITYQLRRVDNELDTSDNYIRDCIRARAAYDPNNKIPNIKSSINSEDFIDKTNPITYTINFQNEGKAPARDVYILDQLSSKLNWESIEIKHASHPMSASLSNTGQLRFDFKDIILPEKAVDEEGSKGQVIFTIIPKSDLEIGDVIRNSAEIYFDANDAVITNTAISRLVKPSGNYDFFHVFISTYPQNAGITTGQGRYIFDDRIKAEAIPQFGYQFKYWTDNGVVVSPNPNYYFVSNKDRYLAAHFTKSTSQIEDAIGAYKIAPNPASDFVYIELDKAISKFTISIASLDGRKVAQYYDQMKIPVESLPRGIYLLELKIGDIVQVEKLILK